MNSTLRDMSATHSSADKPEEEEPVLLPPKHKKPKVKCPGCGVKYALTNSGKIPPHPERFWFRWSADAAPRKECSQNKMRVPELIKVVRTVDSVEINGYEVKAGDQVAFMTRPFTVSFQDKNDLVEWTVDKVLEMSNGRVHLRFKGLEETVPVNIFIKNFIKL